MHVVGIVGELVPWLVPELRRGERTNFFSARPILRRENSAFSNPSKHYILKSMTVLPPFTF
jgi:hypothetical protein